MTDLFERVHSLHATPILHLAVELPKLRAACIAVTKCAQRLVFSDPDEIQIEEVTIRYSQHKAICK